MEWTCIGSVSSPSPMRENAGYSTTDTIQVHRNTHNISLWLLSWKRCWPQWEVCGTATLQCSLMEWIDSLFYFPIILHIMLQLVIFIMSWQQLCVMDTIWRRVGSVFRAENQHHICNHICCLWTNKHCKKITLCHRIGTRSHLWPAL